MPNEVDPFGLMPLPTSPMPAINCFIAYARDNEAVGKVELGHAALHLASFSWGIIDPHQPTVQKLEAKVRELTGKECDELSARECCDKIIELTVKDKESTKKGSGELSADDKKAIDWMTVLALAIQLAQLLFNRKV